MTVKEVILALQQYSPEQNVYVPDSRDNTAQIAKSVSLLEHLNLPEGISIPDDVTITPWTHDEFNAFEVE